MAALSLSSSFPVILRCIIRRPPMSTTSRISININISITPCVSLPTPTPHRPIARTTFSSLTARCLSTETETDVIDSVAEIHNDNPPMEIETDESPVDGRILIAHKEMMSKLKGMSVKEKKELGSYANTLGKKLKSQQVGKSGVTPSLAIALLETLEANELLKLKIHNNCPGELDEVVSQLEEATGSVVVGRIGRTIIIYRPSLTKLKAEEKKKQNLKVFLKRRAAFKSSYQGRMLQSRGESSTPSNRKPYQRSR